MIATADREYGICGAENRPLFEGSDGDPFAIGFELLSEAGIGRHDEIVLENERPCLKTVAMQFGGLPGKFGGAAKQKDEADDDR